MGSILATESCEKSQSTTQCSVESRGFSLSAPVPPTGNVNRVG